MVIMVTVRTTVRIAKTTMVNNLDKDHTLSRDVIMKLAKKIIICSYDCCDNIAAIAAAATTGICWYITKLTYRMQLRW